MSTQTKRVQLVALFVAAFALPMITLTPRPTAAAVRTVAGRGGGCVAESNGFVCSGVAGTDFQVGSLDGAYFDYYTGVAMTVELTLHKQSFSGSLSSDTRNVNHGAGTAARDEWVNAANVLNNPDGFDYLYARIRRTVGGATTGVTPIGIGYVTN